MLAVRATFDASLIGAAPFCWSSIERLRRCRTLQSTVTSELITCVATTERQHPIPCAGFLVLPFFADYQRLEFLGDAVLGWMVTAHLYFASSTFTPAELTRIKVTQMNP